MEQGKILSSGRFDGSYLTRDFVASRFAAEASLDRAMGLRGDHDNNDGHPGLTLEAGRVLIRASVLVPLIDRPEGLSVLLTQRTDHLHDHAGQVSFPGGREEPEDKDAIATALREAQEETGLDPAKVELIGRLDTYITRTSYQVTPIVGLIRPPLDLTPDPFEVAEIFEVPLGFVVDPAHHELRSREFQGTNRQFYVLPHPDRFIWGATAGMLVNLAKLLAR